MITVKPSATQSLHVPPNNETFVEKATSLIREGLEEFERAKAWGAFSVTLFFDAGQIRRVEEDVNRKHKLG